MAQLTVWDSLVAAGVIFGVIVSFLSAKDKLGWGKKDKELSKRLGEAEKEILELKRELIDIKKEQALDKRERRLLMKAMLTLIPDGNPIKGEIDQYLLER